MTARLEGALGEATLVIAQGGVRIERTESPDVRWVLCPLAAIVGGTLASLALMGLRRRLRRPKAAVIYALSAALGIALTTMSVRTATYLQSIRVSSATVEFKTSELFGLRQTRHSLNGMSKVSAWRTGGRYALFAVPARARSNNCAWLMRERWLEPELLATLNQALK